MKREFKTVGLLGKAGTPEVAATLGLLTRHLNGQGIDMVVDAATATLMDDCPYPRLERTELGENADLVVVVGGDGTMLNAARSLCRSGVPMVGVNLGRLGFLADISREQLADSMTAILSGEYTEERRFLLQGTVTRDRGQSLKDVALNDIVLQKRDGGRMIEFETYVNGAYVCVHRADGIVVATPTGSTAYALSGGGPIMHPGLNAVVLVPICPHTLSDRPVVVDADAIVELIVKGSDGPQAQAIYDGQHAVTLAAGESLRITRATESITLLHPQGHDYFKLLRSKLHWGRAHDSDVPR